MQFFDKCTSNLIFVTIVLNCVSVVYQIMFQLCYNGVSFMLQLSFNGVAVVFQWTLKCFSGVSMMLQWCFSYATLVFQWCYIYQNGVSETMIVLIDVTMIIF